MALSAAAHLTAATYSGAATTALTSASISPSANALLMVVFISWKASASAGEPTITDSFSGTGAWTNRNTQLSSNLRITISTAKAGATPGSGTITATVSTGDFTRAVLIISETTGQDTTTPVPQNKGNTGSATTSLTVTLDSTPASTSMVFGAVGEDFIVSDPNIAPGTGFTELNETTSSGIQGQTQYDLTSADATCDWTSLEGGSNFVAGVAIEIAEAGAGGDISGSSAGAATATGTLTGFGSLSGAVAGVGDATAALVGYGALAGQVDGLAAASGALVGYGALAGQSDGQATSTATLAGDGALAGQSDGVATATASLVGYGALAGQSDGAATTIATLVGYGDLAGTISGAATATGTLLQPGEISGTAFGVATTTANLIGWGALSGASAGVATVTGSLLSAENPGYVVITEDENSIVITQATCRALLTERLIGHVLLGEQPLVA